MNVLQNPEFANSISDNDYGSLLAIQQLWSGVEKHDMLSFQINTHNIEPSKGTVRALVLDPLVSGGIDESRTIALDLPYLNGFSDNHLIRARVLQKYAAPHSRLVLFADNSYAEPDNYDTSTLTSAQQHQLYNGDITPIAEMQMKTLENINTVYPLGAIATTGWSKGGLTAIALAALGSDKLKITSANGDEVPHKIGRTPKKLKSDFMKSGGIIDLYKSTREAGIDAYTQAVSVPSLAKDILQFGLMSKTKHGKQMNAAMAGSIESLVRRAGKNGVAVKLGHVAGSAIFEDKWEQDAFPGNVEIVHYGGSYFRKHTSGDNPILHAVTAAEGIKF